VLHGFPRLDGSVVGDAFKQEIERLVVSPVGPRSVDHIDGGVFSLHRNDGSNVIGERIAGVVARAVEPGAVKR
jgi:hypothetical protein